jgi:transposase
MMRYEEMVEIKVLHNQGMSIRKIARCLKVSRNTVRKYLVAQEEPQYAIRPEKAGKLGAYKTYLIDRQTQASPDKIPATVLLREIQAQGYTGQISTLRNYLQQLNTPIEPEEIKRFETPPGKQLQVDWGEFCRRPERVSAFIATLGHSRMAYVEFVNNEKLETLLNCLSHAFDYFGGVAQQILFDNMKTVVVQRNGYGEGHHRFQKTLWDFAKHYGFLPKLCAPYRAQTKGKVERFIGYLRYSFYVPLRSQLSAAGLSVTVDAANQAVQRWLMEVANVRIHATLGERPIDLFVADKAHLSPLPPSDYLGLAIPRPPKSPLHECPELGSPLQHSLAIYQRLLEQTAGVGK